MGASESKLVFKQGIFRLSEERAIPADDPYWRGFWELPESIDDVFSLFSPADIRRTRDSSPGNLETLILVVTSRLNVLRNHPSFPDPQLAPESHALNCIRVLTRVLPYIHEVDHLVEWEEKLFWEPRRRKARSTQDTSEVLFDEAQGNITEDGEQGQQEFEKVKPLAEELLDTLTDLLFFTEFTIPLIPTSKSKVTYAIWQSGVGCKTSIGSNKELESNRCEVLRLLITMMSKALYMSSNKLPVQGVRAITYLATCSDKQIVLSVLCSLLNTVIKYNAASWKVPYDHVVWKDPKQTLVVYSLQFLLVVLLYPVPESGHGPPPKNYYRSWLGKLHRPEDFQFIAEGMSRLLSQPMQATSSYLPGSQRAVRWTPEMIMLFWETVQCNKRFRTFIIDSQRVHDFVILCLFYAIESKTDTSRQGVVRMCVFILQTLSAEAAFGKSLNKKFEAQETLPPLIRLQNFQGSYIDYLIILIHTLLTSSKGKLDAIYPALVAIIQNVAPYAEHLSATACSKLLQLFSLMSSPSFLLANETNHALLLSLLEAINSILEHQYAESQNLIYAVLKSRKQVEALRAFTLETGQEEIERIARRRKEILNNAEVSPSLGSTSPETTLGHNPQSRQGSLSNVPEEGAFAIGDSDDESENEVIHHTPAQSSPSIRDSRASSLSSADGSVPMQHRSMSEKARGKLPVSRQNSAASIGNQAHRLIASPSANPDGFAPSPHWIETWLPELPLHTLLTLIKALSPHLPSTSSASSKAPHPQPRTSSSSGDIPDLSSSTTRSFLSSLPSTAIHPLISPLLAAPSPIQPHVFEWTPLSLGWYESLLWSFIFASETQVGSNSTSTSQNIIGGLGGAIGAGIAGATGAGGGSITSPGGSSGGGGAGAVGVWNGTNIRLFHVREGVREGPTLMRPKGAVDAVGSRIVRGIGGLRLGERVLGTAGNASQQTRSVREV